jgi:hypothetical protein
MTRILRGGPILRIVAAAIVSVTVAWPRVADAQEPDSQEKGVAPTAERHAAHHAALEARHATFKAALEKARANAETARRAFLDQQRAALEAENARVMAEIARRQLASPITTKPAQ